MLQELGLPFRILWGEIVIFTCSIWKWVSFVKVEEDSCGPWKELAQHQGSGCNGSFWLPLMQIGPFFSITCCLWVISCTPWSICWICFVLCYNQVLFNCLNCWWLQVLENGRSSSGSTKLGLLQQRLDRGKNETLDFSYHNVCLEKDSSSLFCLSLECLRLLGRSAVSAPLTDSVWHIHSDFCLILV